jgi:hypothetical protein
MEENTNNETNTNETQEENNIVARAEKANRELAERITHYEALKAEVDAKKAEILLSGNSEAGQAPVEEKEEEISNKDYASQVLKGEHNE